MSKPVVVVVGADKGGVGKTTVSRTLLDYFSANNVPTRAFDTESPRGTLKRFHPDITEIVDMTTTSDQMKIFDTLNSSAPSVTVIDVRAGLLSPALASLRAAAQLISDRSVTLVRNQNDLVPLKSPAATAFFILTEGRASVEGRAFAAEVRKRSAGASVTIVDTSMSEADLDAAVQCVKGTARSMGVDVV